MITVDELYRKFLVVEDELSVFDQEINGIRFWERIRVSVYFSIFDASTQNPPVSPPRRVSLEKVSFYIKSLLYLHRNPLLSGRKDVLFVGTPRRILCEDGFWWDIYTDFLVDELDMGSVTIEEHLHLKHRTPAKTPNLKYFDFMTFLVGIAKTIGYGRVRIPQNKLDMLQEIRGAIRRTFSFDIDIARITQDILARRRIELPFYRAVLNRIRPRVLIMVTSYGKETLIETARRLGIPTVELQHGTISPYHPGYSFPGESRRKETFPDYLFVFGNYWATCAPFPAPSENIISVGYPFLESERKRFQHIKKREQILFISQGRVGKQVADYAVALSEVKNLNYDILLKLHPLDCENWRNRYPELSKSDVQVIDDRATPLYKLFASSAAQIGVFSTAILEGLAFGLKTILLDVTGVDNLRPLVDAGAATIVDSADALVNLLRNNYGMLNFDKEYFFKSGAVKRAARYLKRIAYGLHPTSSIE